MDVVIIVNIHQILSKFFKNSVGKMTLLILNVRLFDLEVFKLYKKYMKARWFSSTQSLSTHLSWPKHFWYCKKCWQNSARFWHYKPWVCTALFLLGQGRSNSVFFIFLSLWNVHKIPTTFLIFDFFRFLLNISTIYAFTFKMLIMYTNSFLWESLFLHNNL